MVPGAGVGGSKQTSREIPNARRGRRSHGRSGAASTAVGGGGLRRRDAARGALPDDDEEEGRGSSQAQAAGEEGEGGDEIGRAHV